MRIKVFLVTIVFLMSFYGFANASTLSNWGPTGISEIPTAYVLNFGVAIGPNVGFYGSDTLTRIPITLGLGVGIEIGATGFSLSSSSDFIPIFHAKWNVIEEKPLLPSISIGGLFDVNNAIGGTSFYVALSKALGNLKGHIGVGSGIYEGIFGALEFKLTDSIDLLGFYKSEKAGIALNINLLSFLNITATYHEGIIFQVGANISL
ncbi:MAG: YjbH domain-containing protein [bacterium]|nr:YjbH domain-containing protein [bacterium]